MAKVRNKESCNFVISSSPLPSVRPFVFVNLIILIIVGGQYKLLSSPSCSFLHFLFLPAFWDDVNRMYTSFQSYTTLLTYLLHGAEPFLRSWLTLQLVKKFPAFLEPEGSSPYSQVPATCPYPESTPSSPHNPLPLPEDPS